MTAAILCIGTELTRGEIVNTNATWLGETLTALGMDVAEIEVTPDHQDLIQETLERLGSRHQVVLCTGGLGPTTDDMTSECVAALLGVPLQRDAESLEAIRQRMARFGREIGESNAKQADFPKGATVLPNRKGTAPGFSIKIKEALCFFLPGVPREMKTMFAEQVAPAIRPLVQVEMHQVRLRTFGSPESFVNEKLQGVESAHQVTIGYRAHFPEIEVKILSKSSTAEEARSTALAATEVVRKRLGDIVFAEGDVNFPEAVGALLQERGWWLGIAESCTGGLASQLITERSASNFFAGSVVTYTNELKSRLLGIEPALIEEHGAVSAEIAQAMAVKALKLLEVDVTLALTGIAGPGGATPDKPVGLVHYAVATRDGVSHRRMVFPGSRNQVQRIAGFAGLALVRQVIRHGHER